MSSTALRSHAQAPTTSRAAAVPLRPARLARGASPAFAPSSTPHTCVQTSANRRHLAGRRGPTAMPATATSNVLAAEGLAALQPADVAWPPHTPLAGSELGSFAHGTITQRLPAILASTISDMEGLAAKEKDAAVAEQLRAAAADILVMRQELLSAHASLPRDLVAPDTASPQLKASVEATNQALAAWRAHMAKGQSIRSADGAYPPPAPSPSSSDAPAAAPAALPGSWLALPWLLVECYMYVRIAVAIQKQPALAASGFDPFHVQKLAGFNKSRASMASMAAAVQDLLCKGCSKEGLYQAVQYALWGNKTDLSLLVDASKIDPTAAAALSAEAGSPFVIVDEFESAWGVLNSSSNVDAPRRVDIVLDNSGLELYSDLCLADVLLEYGLADQVVLHGKPFGWFVSDTIRADLDELLQLCSASSDPAFGVSSDAWAPVQALAKRWQGHLKCGKWRYEAHTFWVTPAPYCWMQRTAPTLYEELQKESRLVVFKGDLNYRKLSHDCRWPYDTPFTQALQGFKPAPLLSLRTLKADVVAGLKPGQGEALFKVDQNWLVNGKFGMIQAA